MVRQELHIAGTSDGRHKMLSRTTGDRALLHGTNLRRSALNGCGEMAGNYLIKY